MKSLTMTEFLASNYIYYVVAILLCVLFWRKLLRFVIAPILLFIVTLLATVFIFLRYAYDVVVYRIRVYRLIKKIDNTIGND